MSGFSLVDILVTVAMVAVLAGISVPMLGNLAEGYKLGNAVREVERELQSARLKAVTSNRPLRVRFNCPVPGQYRTVELIGSTSAPAAADASATRCQETAYPYPAADASPLTRPNHDGPIRRLPEAVAFGATRTLEFWPDGSVHHDTGSGSPWPVLPSPAGTAITLTKGMTVRRIEVNGLGKVTLVQ